MKKLLTLILAAVLSLSLMACGSSTESAQKETSAAETNSETTQETVVSSDFEEGTEAAKLAELYNSGYTMGVINRTDSMTTVNYANADHTDFKQVTCKMTDEQVDDFFALDSFAEDYAQQSFDALSACDNLRVADAVLPDSSEYEGYVGKTVQEMVDAGLDFAGYNDDENGKLILEFYIYPDDGDTYTVHVIPEGNPEDDGSYDDESILQLKVGEISFWEFS